MRARWPQILMYHSICRFPNDPNKDSTSPERFQAQMHYLKRRNLRGVSMRELLRAVNSGNAKGLVGLTFDDGYEDFLQTALPVIESFGFTATVFVVGSLPMETSWEHQHGTKYPMPRMKLLGTEGVREVAARGMEVGAHSMTHAKLSGLEPELLEEEVSGSRRVLSEVLGQAVEGFCYPYGSVDSAAIRAVRRAHYAYACAVRSRVERNAYDLARVPVSERDNIARFAAKLRVYSQYSSAKKILKDITRSGAARADNDE